MSGNRDKCRLRVRQVIDIARLQTLAFIDTRMFASRYRQQPGLHELLVLQTIEPAECPQHRFLNNVVCQMRIPAQPRDVAKQVVTPRCNQPLKADLFRIGHAFLYLHGDQNTGGIITPQTAWKGTGNHGKSKPMEHLN